MKKVDRYVALYNAGITSLDDADFEELTSLVKGMSAEELLEAAEAESDWTDPASAEIFRRAEIDGSDPETFAELGKELEEVDAEDLLELAKKRLGL